MVAVVAVVVPALCDWLCGVLEDLAADQGRTLNNQALTCSFVHDGSGPGGKCM